MKLLIFLSLFLSGCMITMTLPHYEGTLNTEFIPDSSFQVINQDNDSIVLSYYLKTSVNGFLSPLFYNPEVLLDTTSISLNKTHFYENLKTYESYKEIHTNNDSILGERFIIYRPVKKMTLLINKRHHGIIEMNTMETVSDTIRYPYFLVPNENAVIGNISYVEGFTRKEYLLFISDTTSIYKCKFIDFDDSDWQSKRIGNWKYANIVRIPTFIFSIVADIAITPVILLFRIVE